MNKQAKTNNRTCYFCGAPATSTEHAPPKQMFRAFTCDSITVPSCDAHNTEKGSKDQAVVSAFLIPLDEGQKIHKWNLEPNVDLALTKGRSSFERAKRSALNVPLVSDAPGNISNVSYLKIDIQERLKQLTAALICDACKTYDATINWNNSVLWSAEWINDNSQAVFKTKDALDILENNRQIKTLAENLPWEKGWSAHPRAYPADIFQFWLCFSEPPEIFFKLAFYNRYTWYIMLTPSANTVQKLKAKIGIV